MLESSNSCLPYVLPRRETHYDTVVSNFVDPRSACAHALANYLRKAKFRVWGGTADPIDFRLKEVREEWPDTSVSLEYPSASIIDSGPSEFPSHNFTPTILEETYGKYGEGTVLCKHSHASHEFQVDFWCHTIGQREAIAGALPALFSPGETSANVLLPGIKQYYCLPVRAALLRYSRMDSGQSAYEKERRLMVEILCDVDSVSLRHVEFMSPRITVDVKNSQE